MSTPLPAMPEEVAAAFADFPDQVAERLAAVRALAFAVAAEIPEGGGLREYLAWGEPSLRPVRERVGTAIRLGTTRDGTPAVFVHCGTPLIAESRATTSHLSYEGNRAVLIPDDGPLPEAELRSLIERTFTLHLRQH
ncbi:hypothetical protein AB0O87_04200 [Microbacterium sp. NPDC076768]|uniref:hypothetical protein n=1 Tax=Microbacterium sp. NPDC076768 TaxID=3154858 RepID=UPI003414B380